MKKRLTDLSLKIKTTIQPVFISRKLNEDLKFREVKPAIVNQQCLVYQFQCNLCDAGYVGYTRGHLTNHEPTNALMDTNRKSSSIFKHYFSEHNSDVPPFLLEQFHVLTKGFNKFAAPKTLFPFPFKHLPRRLRSVLSTDRHKRKLMQLCLWHV